MSFSIRWVLAGVVAGVVLGGALGAGAARAQPFTYTLVQTDLTALEYGSMAFADLDGDGDFDVVAGGNSNNLPPFRPTAYVATSLDESFQAGQWRRDFQETRLPTEVWHSAVTWIDYDRDGDLDFVITGTTRTGSAFDNGGVFDAVARLYRNDGTGQFAEVEAGLAGVYSSAVARGDYDNDGDDDLLMTGLTEDESPVTRLYRNDGGSGFTEVESAFRNVGLGDAQWADYDNDGDLDAAISGIDGGGGFVTRLYRNDGNGTFAEVDAGLPGLAFSALDFGDYDNDGDLDLALSGGVLSLPNFFDGFAEIYRNDGAGTFSSINAGLTGILYGSVAWGDYDNDGDPDLALIGADDVVSGRAGRIYRNEAGSFAPRLALVGVSASSVAWGDYDDDGDLDVMTAGSNLSFNPLMRLYRNDLRVANTIPTAPMGLQATVQGNSVALSWNAASDDQTAAPGLSYNLRVGTAPGATNIVSPLADAASGRRWVPGRGNADHNTGWRLNNLTAGTYYWSVQAIDPGFKGSAFADEGSFTISATADVGTGTEDDDGLPTTFALHPTFPNPFRDAVTIPYDLPEPTPVTLTVYNVLGAEVGRLVEQVQAAGRHQATWNGRDESGRRVGAGVYFVRMRAGHAHWTQKLIVLN